MTPEGAIIEEAEYEEATVWPRDPEDLDEILAILKKYEGRYTITKSETTGKTTRLIVDGMDGDTMYKLQCSVRNLPSAISTRGNTTDIYLSRL